MPSWQTEHGSPQAQAAAWSLGVLLNPSETAEAQAGLTLRRGRADKVSLDVGDA